MTERSTAEQMPIAARLRRGIRSFEPMYLALLGLLAIPSYVFESLAVLELFEMFFFFFLWPFVAPLVELVVRRGTDEDETVEPTDWIYMGNWREYAAWFLMLPLGFLNPFVLAQDAMQWLGSAVAFARHRGSLPDAEGYDQRVSYRLPFDSAWTVVNGSYDHDYSHSWFPATQRYAYDFVITDAEGRTAPEASGADVEGYYCYDEPILAPAAGVVVDVLDDDLEPSRGGGVAHPLKRDIRGNYVVLQHAADEYSCLAHLVPGSVTVAPGDRVQRGEEIGRCGHSGNSSEPHLHFQLQDHPNFVVAAGLPIAFDDVAIEWPGDEAPITDPLSDAEADDANEREREAIPNPIETIANLEDGTYRPRAHLTAGQRVTHVDRDDGDSSRTHIDDSDPTIVADKAGATRASSQHRTGLASLQQVGFGACVSGVTTFFASIFVSSLTVAALLGAVAAVGVSYRAGATFLRRDGSKHRSSSIGTAVGIGIVAAVVGWYGVTGPAIGIGVQGLGISVLLLGFVGYAVLGEYERLRLRESFPDRGGSRSRPSSPTE
ncbi:M23 family metallopeptidase [Haloterrigena salifodinae]|uniref:M23 family metallopeptidase n=1 Tax=Haloterrigena salifodinae TaxID=2675099 RepID=UPI000F88C783|nr:M23 family metallopeptidase [Haloterrigena salifodinae]